MLFLLLLLENNIHHIITIVIFNRVQSVCYIKKIIILNIILEFKYSDVLFFSEQQSIDLPQFGRYATGILFLNQNSHQQAEAAFENLAEECNLRV